MINQKGSMNIIISFIIVIVFIGIIFYFVKNKKVDNLNEQITENKQGEITNNSQNNMEEKISKTGDVLIMNYTGRLSDGTVFDSNVDPKFGHAEPFRFTLGAGQVIAGWDEGLVGMKVGEKKTLTITPDKGYGAQVVGPIPANSTLIFDVELVGIE
jgi:peptidylprolyl isomerase/FKBP-type peptidyl-prolyl cis-trans isomerase FkpA